MLFNSFEFVALFALCFLLYYIVPVGRSWRKQYQILVMLLGSAIFYAWANPPILLLLVVSSLFNALVAHRVILNKRKGRSERARRWMIQGVVWNLVVLAVFKYSAFFLGLLPEPVRAEDWLTWMGNIPLPVGISFYTFQGISLVVDVWRGDVSQSSEDQIAKPSGYRDVVLYISFFPQLVAGPIVKAYEFFDQICIKNFKDIDWVAVRRNIILGYFLKMFVADNLAEQTAILGVGVSDGLGPIELAALMYGYSFQIFADFAGYSFIAIGVGAAFGYRLPENFRFPYLARSITEFWQRWHLSLSGWLRDYLYIPLGGNRLGVGRTYSNLMTVMLLGGLWHGASWNFVIWGGLHGTLLVLERMWTRRQGKFDNARAFSPWREVLGIVWTFHMVTLLWLTFIMPDFASLSGFFIAMTKQQHGLVGPPVFASAVYGSVIVLYHLIGWILENRKVVLGARMEPALHALMVFLVVVNAGAPRGFIYFQF